MVLVLLHPPLEWELQQHAWLIASVPSALALPATPLVCNGTRFFSLPPGSNPPLTLVIALCPHCPFPHLLPSSEENIEQNLANLPTNVVCTLPKIDCCCLCTSPKTEWLLLENIAKKLINLLTNIVFTLPKTDCSCLCNLPKIDCFLLESIEKKLMNWLTNVVCTLPRNDWLLPLYFAQDWLLLPKLQVQLLLDVLEQVTAPRVLLGLLVLVAYCATHHKKRWWAQKCRKDVLLPDLICSQRCYIYIYTNVYIYIHIHISISRYIYTWCMCIFLSRAQWCMCIYIYASYIYLM